MLKCWSDSRWSQALLALEFSYQAREAASNAPRMLQIPVLPQQRALAAGHRSLLRCRWSPQRFYGKSGGVSAWSRELRHPVTTLGPTEGKLQHSFLSQNISPSLDPTPAPSCDLSIMRQRTSCSPSPSCTSTAELCSRRKQPQLVPLTGLFVPHCTASEICFGKLFWKPENRQSSYPAFCCRKTRKRFLRLGFSSTRSWGLASQWI